MVLFHLAEEKTEGQRSPLTCPATRLGTDSKNRVEASDSPAVAFSLPTAASLDIQKTWLFPRTVGRGPRPLA